jgi:hypothetical protein
MAGKSDQYSPEETEQRLKKALNTAFSMKPTPLKDIPKRDGEKRAGARKASSRQKP